MSQVVGQVADMARRVTEHLPGADSGPDQTDPQPAREPSTLPRERPPANTRQNASTEIVGLATATTVPPGPHEQPRSSRLSTGEMVDHFKVMRLIGRGGMGEVYLARDTQLGRKVALKMIHRKYLRSPEIVERFLFEARATARFSHPNIVAIHAVGDHQGQPYVALEYLEGQTLGQRIEEGTLRPREAARIALATAEALQEAHRRSILHRDLKPSNILINRDGRIRILDFGLAKVIQRRPAPLEREASTPLKGVDTGLTPLQTSGSGLQGTPAYMAPEQWNAELTTEATDLWALGLVLYESMVGRLPYECGDRALLCEAVTSDEPMPVPAAALGMPVALAQLIASCIDKDPARRPTAGEVTGQLERYLSRRRRERQGEEQCPFRGLLPFGEAHVDYFFGRDQEVAGLVERLREEATLALVGPSGSGKSSLARAGVVPRLAEQGAWTVLQLRPGPQPFAALAACLLRGAQTLPPGTSRLSGLVDLRAIGDADSSPGRRSRRDSEVTAEQQAMARQLLESPRTLPLLLQQLAEEQQTDVLLLVDQLEELFTLVDDELVRNRFIEAIAHAADDPQDPARVLLTVRDDFLYRLAETGEMRRVLGRVVLLRSPDARMLEQILVRPLEQTDYRYDDPRLVRQMADAVQGELSCLPLLQFTARQLWDRRDRQRKLILSAAYQEIGGVAGALANHADRVVEGLAPAQRALARQVLLRLVTAEGTRQVLPRGGALEGLPAAAAQVLDQLIQARLVSTRKAYGEDRKEPDLELVHESLIANWARLHRWVEEGREELRFVAEVSQAAQLWQRRGRLLSEAWRGKALDEALSTAQRCPGELPALASEFLQAGQRLQRGRVWRRRGVLVAAFVALAVAALVFATKERETRRQKVQAEGQRAEAQREGARAALARGHYLEARAKLRQSLQTRDSTLARLLWWRLSRVPLVWRQELGDMVFTVDHSADGRLIAAARAHRTVFLLDARTGAIRRVIRGFSAEVHSVAFSPDGRQLATGCINGEVRLWDARTGRPLRRYAGYATRVWNLRFSPDGRYLTAGSYDRAVHVWEVGSGKVARVIRGHHAMALGVAYSPDGRLLATGSDDRTVRLWDTTTWRQVRLLRGHTDDVGAVAFSPDGQQLASAGEDHTVRLWDVAAGRTTRVIRPMGSRVYDLAFSPDGARLAVAQQAHEVQLHRVSDGHLVRTLRGHRGRVHSLRFSPDGKQLTSGGVDGQVLRWRLDAGTRRVERGHSGRITSVDLSADGGLVASASDDRTIRLWHGASGAQLRVLRGHTSDIWSVRFSPDGKLLASASSDHSVRIWSAATGQSVRVLRGHTGRVFGVAFSTDGLTLASGGEDQSARLWDVASGRQLRALRSGAKKVFGVEFSPDGKLLASGEYDGAARLWELSTGKLAKTLRGHEGQVYSVRFSADGRHLLTGCYKGQLRLWDLTTDTARALGRHPRRIMWPAVDPSGTWIASVDAAGKPRLWQQLGPRSVPLGGHRDFVNALAFGANGQLLATGSDSGAVRLWHTRPLRPSWRAPLIYGSPPVLASNRGWIRPGAGGTIRPQGKRPAWQRAARAAAMADASEGLACLATQDHQLQAWDIRKDRRVYSQLVPGVGRVLALDRGCLVLSGGAVALHHGATGLRQVLVPGGATALALARGRILVAADRKVVALDLTGQQRQTWPAAPGVSALAMGGGWLVLGYDYGNMEFVALDHQGSAARKLVKDTPASPVVRVKLTGSGTLVAGYANGLVGIWDLGSGQRLEHARLHGAVVHLRLWRSRLYAATELGDHLQWDLKMLRQRYCALLRQVWKGVPVVWEQGLPVVRPPPKKHRCIK